MSAFIWLRVRGLRPPWSDKRVKQSTSATALRTAQSITLVLPVALASTVT